MLATVEQHVLKFVLLALRCTGASLCATDDGRRLYLFGGHDGNGPLNDCYYLEVEQLLWSATEPVGTPPEPREGHMAAVLGRYLFVSGGCGVTTVQPTGAAGAAVGAGVASAAGTLPGQQPSMVESLAGAAAASASSASALSAAAAAGGVNGAGAAGPTVVGKRLTDTFVLDMYSGPCWEQLHDGSSVNRMWLKQVGQLLLNHFEICCRATQCGMVLFECTACGCVIVCGHWSTCCLYSQPHAQPHLQAACRVDTSLAGVDA